MHFERLRTCDHPLYGEAMELYHASFPPHEQREALSQIEIMGHEDYHFNLIYDQDEMVGVLLWWETARFIYVEHFCIQSELRGKRYGQRALELLNQRGKTVILEIDPPVDAVSIRRKAFYERANYRANSFEHVHPPYLPGVQGHRLVVMSYPEPLTKADYEAFYGYLKDIVMGVSPDVS